MHLREMPDGEVRHTTTTTSVTIDKEYLGSTTYRQMEHGGQQHMICSRGRVWRCMTVEEIHASISDSIRQFTPTVEALEAEEPFASSPCKETLGSWTEELIMIWGRMFTSP
ncbi:hypothetical protein GOP47_0009048 [Adiantum capillus-veneris]|uniref:Uncharacterized protein n=1 Tax=Adiantum capillus-veneris TaxID=13818 RepID=A0A9D4V0E6_ADICA|nr:hypothetical protein GOP47_0009048 [Adiantum capillus-veneris]